jgi:hypothetical protein
MEKHSDRRAGDEDMRVMRYERRTVEVGRRPSTALVEACFVSDCCGRSCEVLCA